MTPFDPIALLTMLLAFYPIVGAAALARARTERPEYFAGGVLFGSKGDKLRLPDGREWDCIIGAGSGNPRWGVFEIPPGESGAPGDDPFALEEGPLTPIDLSAFVRFAGAAALHDELEAELDEAPLLEGALVRASSAIAAAPGRPLVEIALAPLDEAEGGADEARRGLDLVRPLELVGVTDGQATAAGFQQNQWTEPPPSDLPVGNIPPPPTEPDQPEIPDSQVG